MGQVTDVYRYNDKKYSLDLRWSDYKNSFIKFIIIIIIII